MNDIEEDLKHPIKRMYVIENTYRDLFNETCSRLIGNGWRVVAGSIRHETDRDLDFYSAMLVKENRFDENEKCSNCGKSGYFTVFPEYYDNSPADREEDLWIFQRYQIYCICGHITYEY